MAEVTRTGGGTVTDTDAFWSDDWADFLDEQGVDYSHLHGDDLNSRQLRKVWVSAGKPGLVYGENPDA